MCMCVRACVCVCVHAYVCVCLCHSGNRAGQCGHSPVIKINKAFVKV